MDQRGVDMDPSESDGSLAGKEILLVEDNDDTRELLATCLEQSGATVRVASDGLKALVELVRWVPDAIITDLTMPTFDGFEFVRAVRSNLRSAAVPVVAITASLIGEDQSAFDALLRKPLDYD